MWTVQFEPSNQEVCSTVGKLASCEFIRTLLITGSTRLKQRLEYNKLIILKTEYYLPLV